MLPELELVKAELAFSEGNLAQAIHVCQSKLSKRLHPNLIL